MRILSNITHEMLPRVSDRIPSVYIEHAKINVDDASIKVLDSDGLEHSIPAATVMNIMLGPGTSITHEAIKAASKLNTCISWVGEESLFFYSHGKSPTASVKNIRQQVKLHSNLKLRTNVARNMYSYRFSLDDIKNKTISQMMGMEGIRIKNMYSDLSKKYSVPWMHRKSQTSKWDSIDVVNQTITAMNSYLYSLILSSVYALGYIPQIGFIHTSGGLPFVYDIADLYKEYICFEPAFKYASNHSIFDNNQVNELFRREVHANNIIKKIPKDIEFVLGVK